MAGTAFDYAKAFERNCPGARLTKDEREELERLFRICRDERKSREPTVEELDVIEAAQDWANAQEGSKYGPMQHEVRRAEKALIDRVADLAAQNDGAWRRPE